MAGDEVDLIVAVSHSSEEAEYVLEGGKYLPSFKWLSLGYEACSYCFPYNRLLSPDDIYIEGLFVLFLFVTSLLRLETDFATSPLYVKSLKSVFKELGD